MPTQPPITLVPPNNAVVTKEWSSTTTSATCLHEWEGKTYYLKHFIYVSTLHIISHSFPVGTLSLLCHRTLLHLSNSTHPVTLPYISPLPTILR